MDKFHAYRSCQMDIIVDHILARVASFLIQLFPIFTMWCSLFRINMHVCGIFLIIACFLFSFFLHSNSFMWFLRGSRFWGLVTWTIEIWYDNMTLWELLLAWTSCWSIQSTAMPLGKPRDCKLLALMSYYDNRRITYWRYGIGHRLAICVSWFILMLACIGEKNKLKLFT